MEFTDKAVCITGASVGIGYACALKFAENGANLILMDINGEKLKAVREQCLKMTEKVSIYTCDVSDEAAVKAVFEDALAKYGTVDVLINNAAVWRDSAKFIDAPTELWQRYWNINVMGTVFCTKAVLPNMMRQRSGHIVNVASVAGVYGNGSMSFYSATKGAIISMTKALAKEVAKSGIQVNAVSPGTVSDSSDADVDSFQPNDMSHMGRTGTDRENAELIYFLSTDRCLYLSGQNVQIDGVRHLI